VPYIEHYTNPGDLVLDPFCGSGMTGVAAVMTGRHVILNDLSPAAVHIAYNYCTPVDVKALKLEFSRIQKAVKAEFDWLYGTTCDRCGGPATIQYMIWSDVFECARCGGEIVLWNAAVDPDTGKVAREFTCPSSLSEKTSEVSGKDRSWRISAVFTSSKWLTHASRNFRSLAAHALRQPASCQLDGKRLTFAGCVPSRLQRTMSAHGASLVGPNTPPPQQ
jgi:hypothetical protein